MILTTTETIPGKDITEILGIVRGNTIESRHIGSDIGAGLKQLVGGEIKGYTKMITKARNQATKRMQKEAKKLGADAIINIRYANSEVMKSASEVLAYGTAVKIN